MDHSLNVIGAGQNQQMQVKEFLKVHTQ